MTINYAILGLLSCKPLTGYDLKKIIQDSPFMYWSGNNNQIYKALLELYEEGFVTNEVHHQDGSPSKKVYDITPDGLAALKKWSLSLPEAPEMKKAFLIQLAWTGQLNQKELDALLTRYEQEINGQIFIEQERSRKAGFTPNRTPRETAIWQLIHENVLQSYINELEWTNKVRQTIGQLDYPEGDKKKTAIQTVAVEHQGTEKLTYQVVEKNNQRYIRLDTAGTPLRTEQDGLDLVTICAENETTLLLIPEERLSDEFLRLSSGVANAVLSKLIAYGIKAVAILPESKYKGKFKDFVSESSRGNTFGVYHDTEQAEIWLLSK